ncbi:GNAT family N-acetyltransferase [Rheinheimera sp.]|uniref:GNAT family N-acetyltransferase n=1 Tax=Rheinheimera sp. TaxID=1869214 RepID=UPI00307F28FB
MELRVLCPADLPALLTLQAECYPLALNESAAVMQGRLEGFSASCWGLFKDRQLHAYLLSYPSTYGNISALGADFSLCAKPDTLYLHDMAVSSASRGAGLANLLLHHAEHYARQQQFGSLTLVAVQGAERYWHKLGFSILETLSLQQQAMLHSYQPEQALYMHKQLF